MIRHPIALVGMYYAAGFRFRCHGIGQGLNFLHFMDEGCRFML